MEVRSLDSPRQQLQLSCLLLRAVVGPVKPLRP